MTHPTDALRLMPCPFCGGEAWLNDYEAKYSDLPPKSRCPQCRSCGASMGYLPTPAKAVEVWNRRAAPASPLPEGGGDWIAIRNAFVRHAEAFVKASRYEEASAISDKAAREIQDLMSPIPAAPTGAK